MECQAYEPRVDSDDLQHSLDEKNEDFTPLDELFIIALRADATTLR